MGTRRFVSCVTRATLDATRRLARGRGDEEKQKSNRANMATRGAGEVKIRVNALPMCEDEAHPYLTCFQHSRAFFERTRTVRVYCAPSETVRGLKEKVRAMLGERVEMIRRGGARGGIELRDEETLGELGLGARDMSVWEHLWVDSEARMRRMEEDKEKMMKIIDVRPNDMTPKMIRMLKDLAPPSRE